MTFTDYFSLALSNLRQRGLRSLLTMLGIFIGIAAVVSLITLGQGLQDAITGQFSTLNPDTLLVQNAGTGFGPPGSTVVRKLTNDDLNLIVGVGGVKETIVRIVRIVSFEFNGVRKFNTITSIPEDSEQIEIILNFLNADVDDGKLLAKDDLGKVMLGNGFADDDFGRTIRVGSNVRIQEENFEVIGILEQSSNFFINDAIFMLDSDIEELLDIKDEIDLIVVQVEDEDQIEEIALEIERILRKDRKLKLGEEDFSVQTPLQAVETINTVLGIVQLIVSGIAAVSLLVGGIGIANTMYTSVLERTREIGVMKAVGARNRDILGIFMIESAFLGLVGGVIGVVLGLGLAFGASAAASAALGGALELGVSFDLPLILAAIGFSLFVGMLAGIIPAVQASKLNPVDALRN
jgi:putative ABC transport system permease protein